MYDLSGRGCGLDMELVGQTRTRFKDRIQGLVRERAQTIQVNLGKLCNQVCLHCHVDAGPHKTKENMNRETVDNLLKVLEASSHVKVLDLTGGAPELNPEFRRIVTFARELGLHVIDRCNLTVLFEKGQEDLAQFLADQRVEVVASLPCYLEDNVDKQRGDGVFEKSIAGLSLLNKLGFGVPGSGLTLNLVFNPSGPVLPPSQVELEARYKTELFERFGIKFNRLFTITNMPIKRFLFDLKKSGQYESYMQLLATNFNDAAFSQVMCKSMVSVGWDGKLFDCDFNQMLNLPLNGERLHLNDLQNFDDLNNLKIKVADHCYGCTAGQGSSCRGSLA